MTKLVLLLGVGLLLILVEVLIPSGGAIGVVASGCIIGAVAWGFYESTAIGIQLFVAAALLVPIFIAFAFKLLPRSPFAKKLIVKGFSFEDGEGTDARNKTLLGKRGTVDSPLRPAGMARIDGVRVDVVSRGELIDVGVEVEVIEVQGNRVVVARAGEDATEEGTA